MTMFIVIHAINKFDSFMWLNYLTCLFSQESFQIAHLRQKKIEEHLRAQQEHELKIKQERSEAIRKGERVLQQVRSDVKHVMMQTKLELRVRS